MGDNFIFIISVLIIIIVLAIFKSKIRVRNIVEDFEATLKPTHLNEYSQAGRGKIERELYGDGNAGLKIKFSGTVLPEGSTVSLIINRTKIGDFQVFEGRVYEKIETRSGLTVPSVKAGDEVEILYDGTTVLSGTFQVD